VLVVVHQDKAIGVGGNAFQVLVGGGDHGVDVEAEIARMQVGVKLADEADIAGRGIVGQAFDVER